MVFRCRQIKSLKCLKSHKKRTVPAWLRLGVAYMPWDVARGMQVQVCRSMRIVRAVCALRSYNG